MTAVEPSSLPARLPCPCSLPLNEKRNGSTSQVSGKTGLSYPDPETVQQETGQVAGLQLVQGKSNIKKEKLHPKISILRMK